jgi:NadR type nicotinamide-nucleotide adenylyltransferase
MLKKIVITGPESTGKSTLCEQLAAHYKTVWCAEYAREYLLKHGIDYNFDDLITIAKGQLNLEEQHISSIVNRQSSMLHSPFTSHLSPVFIDTDMYVMKVWCEYVFGKCHQYILDEIVARKYDLYLLCNIDLPWVADELREYPNEEPRKELYQIYKDIMINQQTPWVDISGDYAERLEKAIAAVDAILTERTSE